MQTVKYMIGVLIQSNTFPCFDVAHNLLAAIEIRNELGSEFSRIHTFASWLFTMIFIFSGSMTANLLLGEPVISPLSNNKLFLATVIWYLVFFTPSNYVYNAVKCRPVRIIACAINEVYRARKLGNGITQAAQFYPDSWIVMIAIGTIRANGSGLMKLLIRLMQKSQTPKDPGFMQLSFTTKISILAAIGLVLEKKATWFSLYEFIQLIIAVIFVCIKLTSLCDIISYQSLPFENWFYTIIFGSDGTSKALKQPNVNQKTEKSKDLGKKDE